MEAAVDFVAGRVIDHTCMVGLSLDIGDRWQVIEIRVAELRQLFNAIDPSPFRQRDLDRRAEEFIVDWASDLPMNKPWALVVHLDRRRGAPTKLRP
jgi:hypothetical protein